MHLEKEESSVILQVEVGQFLRASKPANGKSLSNWGKFVREDLMGRKCLQYVTRGGQRVRCNVPCDGFYCEEHGGHPDGGASYGQQMA